MILYHNTSNENAISISKEGIKGGMRLHVYGKGSEAEGAGIWCVSKRGYGYGGATITFEVDENDRDLVKQNDTEYIMYKDIPTSDIIDIDLMISDIPCNYSRTDNVNSTVESDIPNAVKQWGKDKVLEVFERNPNHFAKPYNIEQLKQLIETGNKYCKGTITFTESKKIVESNNQSIIDEITKIVDTCKKYNIIKDLRRYTIPIMRDYQLRYNPTADSRRAPWVYLINEINSTNGELDSALEDFIDGFVREGNQCIKDNIKTENKIIESSQDRINEFIEKELNDGTSWDIDTKLDWLKDKMYKQIRLIGRKINNAKYDYERNNLKRNQDFCKEVLAEINNRLKETKLEEDLNDAYRLLRTYVKEEVPEYKGISNIEMTTTKRGEEALKFNFNGDRYLVLRYPKEKKRLAYYKNNENIRYANNIVEILDDNIKSKMTESKHKLEEVSRNELLAKSKAETITRYNKSAGYKGFSLVDIDTTAIKTRDVIIITNRVGDYYDTVELDDILYWVGLEVDEARDKKMTLETVRRALLGAMDGMNMKVDCNCGDFCLEENTKIKLLNNEVISVKDMKSKFDKGEELWVYSTDEKGDFKPGKVSNVWISGNSIKMVKITLDNGKEIITTPNHRYMMRDGSYKEAQYLSEYDSLMPLYFSYHNGYENVKLNSKKGTQFHSVYKIVADTVLKAEKEEAKIRSGEDIIQIHHKDFNKLNNYPSNLEPKGKSFSNEHKNKIRNKLLESSNERQKKGIITRCKNTLDRVIDSSLPVTEENFTKCKGKYDPSYTNVFDSFEDMLKYFNIPINNNHKVASVEIIEYSNPIDVYDISVDNYHNFYVDAGVMLHNCYRFAYMATVLEYKYGKPENRPSNITNPNGYGAMCKHLISLLSNKSWVKQVATTLQQWIIDEIDWVRDFLKVSEEDFQLPDEYARYIGKHGAMKKVWDKIPDAEENAEEPEDDTEDTNEDALETDENNEATNGTPEKQTMNNQTNMPKSLRNNNQDEELEEK